MNRLEYLIIKFCYGGGLTESEYQEYKQLTK